MAHGSTSSPCTGDSPRTAGAGTCYFVHPEPVEGRTGESGLVTHGSTSSPCTERFTIDGKAHLGGVTRPTATGMLEARKSA